MKLCGRFIMKLLYSQTSKTDNKSFSKVQYIRPEKSSWKVSWRPDKPPEDKTLNEWLPQANNIMEGVDILKFLQWFKFKNNNNNMGHHGHQFRNSLLIKLKFFMLSGSLFFNFLISWCMQDLQTKMVVLCYRRKHENMNQKFE